MILKRIFIQVFQALADCIGFFLGSMVAIAILVLVQDSLHPYFPVGDRRVLATLHLSITVACVAWFWLRLRHYTYRKAFWSELGEILRTVALFSLVELVVIALLRMDLSRYLWVITWGATLVLVPVFRFGLRRVLMYWGLWQKPCVFIGAGPNAKEAYAAIMCERDMGFNVKFFLALDRSECAEFNEVPIITDEVDLWAHTNTADTHYFIATEAGQESKRDYWIKQTTLHHCRNVSVIPTTRGLPLNSIDASFIFSHDVLILRIHENLRKRSARIAKRAFDILGSATLLLMLSPLILYLWVRIGREGGSPIYGHERVGFNGKTFKCLKFRSMVLNSREVLAQLLESDPKARAEWEADFKLKNDPRITSIGHFLRRSSLDELPQLWNVLRGEMSLVGPRPVVQDELTRYGEQVDYYLMAKPGMTGLWQVSGRNNVDYATRVYFDAWYVKNWSLWHDIAILFKTIGVVLKRSGAY